MKVINKEELHDIFETLRVNREENIFNELYSKYGNLVYSIAFSLLKNKENSEDVKQIVFSKIWKMKQDKLPTKNETSWLYTLTKNETLNYIRKQNQTISLDELYYISYEDEELKKLVDIDAYNKIISRLNNKEQEIVSLKILSNLSFKEIAEVLNEPIGTIQWRYYKSVHILKILLSNLSMFIVTITLFITHKIFRNTREKSSSEIEQSKSEITSDKITLPNQSDSEEQKVESSIQNSNTIVENTIVDSNNVVHNTNKIDIGFLSIAIFFLITTITFLIIFAKNQQKAKKMCLNYRKG